MTAPDRASSKASELMGLILDPDVTLDAVEKLLAWEFRITEAQTVEATFRQCRLRNSTPEEVQNEFERR